MFVRQSKYDELLARVDRSEHRFSALLVEWNGLVRRINKLGGEDFLRHATVRPALQFTADELAKLVQLCHPDKHDGKPMATEMTQKLLALKGALTKEPA